MIRHRLDKNATSMTQRYYSIFGRMEKKYNKSPTLKWSVVKSLQN